MFQFYSSFWQGMHSSQNKVGVHVYRTFSGRVKLMQSSEKKLQTNKQTNKKQCPFKWKKVVNECHFYLYLRESMPNFSQSRVKLWRNFQFYFLLWWNRILKSLGFMSKPWTQRIKELLTMRAQLDGLVIANQLKVIPTTFSVPYFYTILILNC